MSVPTQMLQDLGTIHTGSTPKTNDESLFGGDIPFVTPGDLGEITPIHTATRSLTEEGAKTGTLLPAGSVLVCCIGSLGKIGFAGRSLVTNQQINAIVFDDKKIDPRYGFFACRLLKPQLESMAPATTVPIVNKSRFSELKIPAPPLKEQRRIAAILDQAETLRTQRRTALALLDSLTQSLFLDMFGDPVNNPLSWKTLKVEQLAEQVTDGEHLTPKREPQGIKLLSARNVRDGYIDFQNVDFVGQVEHERIKKRCNPVRGDVLISCSGSIGRVASVETDEPFSLVRSVAMIRPKTDFVLTKFLEYYLRTPAMNAYMIRRANASSHANLFQGPIREIPVMLPPLPLQQTFATRIAAIEALKATHRCALVALDALFASLQQRAFAGVL